MNSLRGKEEIVPVYHDPDDVDATTKALAPLSGGAHNLVPANFPDVIIVENEHVVAVQQEEMATIVQEQQHYYEEQRKDDDELEQFEVDGTIDPNAPKNIFFCPNCGNCFGAAGYFKLHLRACQRNVNEPKVKALSCKVCDKIFSSVVYLKRHLMRHTENLFRCGRCYLRFVDETKYNTHVEAHKHREKLEEEALALSALHGGKKMVIKEFNCCFCKDNFREAFEVGQEKYRYVCDTCRDKHSKPEAVRQAKQRLKEKREFICDRCGRIFSLEGFLQRHLFTCDGTIKRRR